MLLVDFCGRAALIVHASAIQRYTLLYFETKNDTNEEYCDVFNINLSVMGCSQPAHRGTPTPDKSPG